MRNLVYLTTLFSILLILHSCKTGTDDNASDVNEVNPYIQGFTSGEISRFDPVYILFNEDIDEKKQNEDEIRKHIKISPNVEGNFSFENSHTIVFRPANGLGKETTYKITADLSGWFPVNKKDKEFSFQFSTYPLRVRAQLESMNVSEDNINAYDIHFSVTTTDREEDDVVQSLISYSETVNQVSWQHMPDGKHHLLTLRNIPASESGRRTLDLSVGKNKQNAETGKLVSVSIPSQQEFSVYDVQMIVADQTYIEVTFTQPVDSKQNMEGLVWLEQEGQSSRTSGSSVLLETEGNKIKVFPNSSLSGVYNVYVSKEIKSNRGKKLDENVIREISVSNELPGLEFIGKGVIIPNSDKLIVPFKAVYLRGVVVRVIRIMEHNVGQFLQVNHLDGKSQLKRVGRLVSRQIVFLDEEGKDLSHWNTYAIDLRKLIDPEPGAIYRVELSFDRELSAYPCAEGERVPKNKEQLQLENDLAFKAEVSKYDEIEQYYYYWDYDYDYDYRSNDSDPCRDSYYSNRFVARNILATNLGIIAKRNAGNEMLVLVRNIATTAPESSVNVTLHNYQGEVVGSGTTDSNGQVRISMSSGKPFYIMATSGKQRSYLRVDDGASLSLSSFDVSGEVIQKGIKGFIYGDRGVWRPGDTLYLSFMLNDRNNTLPANHPVVMELYNPNGQLYLKKTQTKGEMGTYAFEMPTDPDAPTGAWNVQVHVGGVTFHKRLRVETIKPNRLKIDLKHDKKVLLRNYTLKSDMHVEWLTGATAKNLKYEIEGTFTTTTTQFDGFPNYVFDDRTKTFNTEEAEFAKGTTDEKGDEKIESSFSVGSKAPGMLNLSLFTRVYEESGDFSIDGDQLLYSPYEVYAGIRSPQTSMDHLDTGRDYTFEVASVGYDGKVAANRELEVMIYKVSWYWWWDSNNNTLANYITESHRKPVKTLTVKTGANGQGTLKLKFDQEEWGTYYIQVKEKQSGHTTGVMSYFDWPGWAGRRDTERGTNANILSFKTDKKNYEVGEKIKLTIPSAEGSRAVISVENGSRVVSVTDYNGQAGETIIEMTATDEMMPNAFLHVTLLQPHVNTQNDAPIRMYGVMPVEVTSKESHLNPEIRTVDEIRPEETYDITVSEKDGREMSYTLAIVDEGLLDLTRFPTPDPWRAFNAREALGITTWDLYNYVVGAYGGRIEQIFSIGGDGDLNAGKKAVVNRFKPVVEFAGPFYLKKGEKRRHIFSMPNYNGRVRVMLVAGDGSAYGSAEKSVIVRKPVMLLGTLPRIIGTNEEMEIPATVFATEAKVGKVSVSITCSDNMVIVGSKSKDLNFSDIGDKQTSFRIKVKNRPGAGKVTLTATGKGEKTVYETDIEIRSVQRPQTKVIPVTLEGGKSWKQTVKMPGEEGTNSLILEVSDVPPLNLGERLNYLIGYPHGCIEQITSKGFPQLYLKQVANLTAEQERITEGAVKEVIRRMRSYQMPSGAFSYWPGGSDSYGWASTYATHFMLEAEAKGYLVPENMKKAALNDIKRTARNWKSNKNNYARSEEMTQAYRLYLLALGRQPEVGAMNRMKEQTNLDGMAKWMLAGAYALIGREDVGNSLITQTTSVDGKYDVYDRTFGSNLRDKAIQLQTLVLLKKSREASQVVKELSQKLSTESWYSTQTTAYCLMAVTSYMNRHSVDDTMVFSYNSDGKKDKINSTKSIWSSTLVQNGKSSIPVEVKNEGKGTLFVQVITEGIPVQGTEEAYANDVSITTRYTDTNKKNIEVDELEPGTNFVAVVTVKNPSTQSLKHLVLTQIFPAGWEILNTRFLNEDGSSSQPSGVNYQDFRDDRVYSYIDLLAPGKEVTIRINLCAVYSGKFYLPPVWCEAMYDHLVRANTEGSQVVVK